MPNETEGVVGISDEEWAALQDREALRFLGVTADEFRRRWHSGYYDHDYDHRDDHFELEMVLGYFPELTCMIYASEAPEHGVN